MIYMATRGVRATTSQKTYQINFHVPSDGHISTVPTFENIMNYTKMKKE